LNLPECEQLCIPGIFGSNYALFLDLLFQGVFFTLLGDFWVMKEIPIEEEVLDFEHVHLQSALDQPDSSILSVFANPIDGRSVRKYTDFGQ
jgi:hypothetical protein